MTRRLLATLLVPASILAGPAAGAQTFDFDAAPFGNVPFTLTSGGVSAALSSPNGFVEVLDASALAAGTVSGLTGRYVGDVDGFIPEPLTIAFDRALGSLSVSFAIFDLFGVATDLSIEAFLGAASVGTFGFVGAVQPGFVVPEGTAAFGGVVFDRVVISSTSTDLAIDDLAVSAVPEPATAGLVAAGLAALGAAARRRRRAPSAAA